MCFKSKKKTRHNIIEWPCYPYSCPKCVYQEKCNEKFETARALCRLHVYPHHCDDYKEK